MAAARNYSSVARATTLTASVNGSVNVFPVTETTGFPSPPFTMVADPGRSAEEIVTVTAVVGLNLTVIRGEDGSSAQPHDAAASLRHMATARDYREAGVHVGATAGVHGVTGALVGATDVQSMDNKTFTATLTDHTPIKVRQAASQGTPLLVFSDSSNATVASVGVTGRLAGPGIDGAASSTFLAGSPATVPLTIQGAVTQTAALQSWRDSTSTQLAFIAPSGELNAPSVVAGAMTTAQINATAITTAGIAANGQSTFTTTVANQTPLTILDPPIHSANSLSVKNSAGVIQSGIKGVDEDFQLFQGNSLVPYRIHAGTAAVTILSGNVSQGGSINIASFGFTQNPIVMLTIRQFEEDTIKRRVGVNCSGITVSSISFRAYQASNEALSDNTNYTIEWMAIQMTPSASPG